MVSALKHNGRHAPLLSYGSEKEIGMADKGGYKCIVGPCIDVLGASNLLDNPQLHDRNPV